MDSSRSAVKPGDHRLVGVPTVLNGHLARKTADRSDDLKDICS